MAALFRMPRPAFLALSLLSLLTAPGCDTEDDDTTADENVVRLQRFTFGAPGRPPSARATS